MLGVPGFAGQQVVGEIGDVGGVGLFGDGVEHVGGEHLAAEEGNCCFDLFDGACRSAADGSGEVGGLDGSDDR